MKTNNIRTKMTIADKTAEGKLYEITDVLKDSVELTEKLSEEQEAEGVIAAVKTVPITALESCFAFVEDPNPAEVPTGYSVKDGILMKDKAPATVQGELEFIDVLATVPGKVLLTAKTRDKAEDAVEVFAYDPVNDTFAKIVRAVSEVKLIDDGISDVATMQLLTTQEVVATRYDEDSDEDVAVTDKDGNEIKALAVKELTLAVYDGEEINFIDLQGTVDNMLHVGVNDSFILIESKQVLSYNEYGVRVLSDVENGVSVSIIGSSGTKTLVVPEMIAAATISPLGLVIQSGDMVWVENKGHNPRTVQAKVVSSLKGYNYLVDADIRNSVETYVFADDNYDVKTLVRKRTYDRGDIITVE